MEEIAFFTDPSFKRGSQKKRHRGSETRSVIRGSKEVFDLDKPLKGLEPLSGAPKSADPVENATIDNPEAILRAKFGQMMM